MNKYMGFYELKSINIPSVQWQQFAPETKLDPGLLWTVRTAVESGSDTSLQRAVGVTAQEAEEKGGQFLKDYAGSGIVIYYPYFIADKSGVIDINSDKTVIEAVDKDLWNLVTEGKRDVTIIVPKDAHVRSKDAYNEPEQVSVKKTSGSYGSPDPRCLPNPPGSPGICFIGNREFLSAAELSELLRFASVIRGRFREDISEGRSVIAEWSYAYNTDVRHEPAGDRYLVFYELRSI